MAKKARAPKVHWFTQNEQIVKKVLAMIAEKQFRDLVNQHGVPGAQLVLAKAGATGVDPALIVDHVKNVDPKRLRAGAVGPLRLPTQGLTTSYKKDLFDGIHQVGDTYKIALYVSASTIGPSTTAYTATNEVANGNGYTTGGLTLSGRQVVLDGTTQILDWTTDPVWATSTITARGALIYNSSRSNASLVVLDFGADITSTNGNFTVQLPSPTAAAGAIRL
jgi:hypothetical protein